MAFSREEIEAAFDRYRAAAAYGAQTGDWKRWADCFTPDVRYVEHLFGEFQGQEAVLSWITETMGQWPNTHMREFPWDWYTIDVEQGFVIGQVQNRFIDPGDGHVYEAPNWTRLVYGGDGLFSEEEDIYNPARMAPMVKAWIAAWVAHHPA